MLGWFVPFIRAVAIYCLHDKSYYMFSCVTVQLDQRSGSDGQSVSRAGGNCFDHVASPEQQAASAFTMYDISQKHNTCSFRVQRLEAVGKAVVSCTLLTWQGLCSMTHIILHAGLLSSVMQEHKTPLTRTPAAGRPHSVLVRARYCSSLLCKGT